MRWTAPVDTMICAKLTSCGPTSVKVYDTSLHGQSKFPEAAISRTPPEGAGESGTRGYFRSSVGSANIIELEACELEGQDTLDVSEKHFAPADLRWSILKGRGKRTPFVRVAFLRHRDQEYPPKVFL